MQKCFKEYLLSSQFRGMLSPNECLTTLKHGKEYPIAGILFHYSVEVICLQLYPSSPLSPPLPKCVHALHSTAARAAGQAAYSSSSPSLPPFLLLSVPLKTIAAVAAWAIQTEAQMPLVADRGCTPAQYRISHGKAGLRVTCISFI